jgi:hypothetical protein
VSILVLGNLEDLTRAPLKTYRLMKSPAIMRLYSLLLIFAVSTYNVEAFFHHVTSNGNQHRYCNKRNLVMKLEYRNAKISDVGSISELCSESFDGPFQWHQQIQRLQSIDSFRVQLTDRLNNLVFKGVKHCMIVAVDGEKPEKSSIVGFLEVGLLPSPIGLNEPTVIRDDPSLSEVSDAAVTSAEEISASTEVSSSNPEKMEVGAESASPSACIGSVTSTEADDTNNVANSSDNGAMVTVSENQNSENVLLERFVDANELVLAAAALEVEQRRKNKREVPYLGNVAVSQDCR